MSTITPLLPGDPERIASYRIVGRLGSGGMGTVYAALGPDGRRVAVKAVHAQQAADPQFRARFHREVQVLARVGGPCLVPLLDADPAADIPWLATDYIPGPTLQQHLTARGPLTGIQLCLFAAGTASALAAIHAAGVIHRDLKPANVILSPNGPRLLDFGIAHIADGTAVTRTGTMTGTPGWISPEHYRDGTADAPADIFTWGALIAYAATDRPPFGTGAPDVIAFRVMSGQADLNGLPEELLGVVESCLAKEPEHRPPARALAQETAELLGHHTTQVLDHASRQPTAVQTLITERWQAPTIDDPAWATASTRRRKRRTAWLAATALLAAAGAAAGTWAAITWDTPESRKDTASGPSTPATSPRTAAADPAEAAGDREPSSAPPQTMTKTKVHTVTPWTTGGIPADTVTIIGETVGACMSSSGATMRVDAWRCNAESQILDPCFSPSEVPEAEAVLCMGTNPTRMVRLVLTEPLPGNNNHIPGRPPIDPFIIVLDDGNTCRMMTGATTVTAGERQNYACAEGGSLYGFPDKTTARWTISFRADGAATSTDMPIATAYQ